MNNGLKRFDPYVLIWALVASVVGLLVVFDAGYARSMASGKGPIPREFIVQGISLLVSLVVGIYAANARVQKVFQSAKGWWWLTLVLLVGVMVPHIGYEMNGAHRWYKLGPFTFQPAEFAKLTSILYVAAILHHWKAWPAKLPKCRTWTSKFESIWIPKLRRLWPAGVVLLAVGFIAIEPDLGTGAIVAAIAWTMFAVGGVSRKSLLWVSIVGLAGCWLVVRMEPYRMERIENHQHRWDIDHVDDTGFQTVQSELAGAAGKWIGVGVGAGRAKHVMPAATTDFVTSTVAEEFGFLGWCLIVAPIAALSVRLLQLAPTAPTKFGRLVCIGTGAWIAVQSVVNIMMANGTLPAIGVPLPFISSGGSSLIAIWLALGVSQAAMQPILVKKEGAVEADRHRWRHGRTRFSGA